MRILETDRLILRPWDKKDADDLFLYAKDPNVGPITGWMPHKSIDESLFVIENVFTGNACFAICLKETNRPIGSIELILNGHTNVTDKDSECELGFWLGKPFWKQGYMTEAIHKILQYGFLNLNMSTIYCGYYEGNIKSKGIQEKFGFTHYKTTENIKVELVNEVRTGHMNILTKDKWTSFKK